MPSDEMTVCYEMMQMTVGYKITVCYEMMQMTVCYEITVCYEMTVGYEITDD